ncbi:MAG: Lrp/AsnC family transcriptional regulator [Candidatus Pacearchaeota archaeon]
MELKPSDKKLLSYLYQNNRDSFKKISKATNLSRQQVEYRVKNYIKIGLIKKFATFFNYSSLGYNYMVILFLKFSKQEYLKEFSDSLTSLGFCISKGEVYNDYDLFINSIFRNEAEFTEILNNLLDEYKGKISDYRIIKPISMIKYPLKFIKNKEEEIEINFTTESITLDKKEIKILRLLEQDSRIKIIDIANSINISAELVLYKLKRLYEKKMILGSRILFDMEKLGYNFSVIGLTMSTLSNKVQSKIKEFSKQSLHVNSVIFTISKPNCYIQLFHKDERELRREIYKLKKLFSEELLHLEILLIEGEKEANTLPFLGAINVK